ncbi:hypothetical protein OAL61_04360 [Candidatus Pelagibacter sp.]|nr:hypothetical protein [Candidatus Pelagibacter sp.]
MMKQLFKTPFARGNSVGFILGIIGFLGPFHLMWIGVGIILWTWVEKYFFSNYDNRIE